MIARDLRGESERGRKEGDIHFLEQGEKVILRRGGEGGILQAVF